MKKPIKITKETEQMRKSRRKCINCFYHKSSIAGQAFTEYTCFECKQVYFHPNTAVPNYCNECCDRMGICSKCGQPNDKTERIQKDT